MDDAVRNVDGPGTPCDATVLIEPRLAICVGSWADRCTPLAMDPSADLDDGLLRIADVVLTGE
jgi:hypothetical protein